MASFAYNKKLKRLLSNHHHSFEQLLGHVLGMKRGIDNLELFTLFPPAPPPPLFLVHGKIS